ncbi:hypothetical protein C8R46DRAFT_1286192 [Mycena filopes]|nr:hypothetical protein C8R46DRAFT_1286192 [Mycena filopes]
MSRAARLLVCSPPHTQRATGRAPPGPPSPSWPQLTSGATPLFTPHHRYRDATEAVVSRVARAGLELDEHCNLKTAVQAASAPASQHAQYPIPPRSGAAPQIGHLSPRSLADTPPHSLSVTHNRLARCLDSPAAARHTATCIIPKSVSPRPLHRLRRGRRGPAPAPSGTVTALGSRARQRAVPHAAFIHDMPTPPYDPVARAPRYTPHGTRSHAPHQATPQKKSGIHTDTRPARLGPGSSN